MCEWDQAIEAVLDICDKMFIEEERAGRIARKECILKGDVSLKAMICAERALAIARAMDEIKVLKR